jgi:hypothetical protein
LIDHVQPPPHSDTRNPKDGFATKELIGKNSILEARLNKKGPGGMAWFYEGSKNTNTKKLLGKYADKLGVKHIVQGHQYGNVKFPDGSMLRFRGIGRDYDPTDKINAMRRLHETARRGEFATGLIYIEPDRDDFLTQLNVVDEPLAFLPLSRTRPGPEALEEIMEGLR